MTTGKLFQTYNDGCSAPTLEQSCLYWHRKKDNNKSSQTNNPGNIFVQSFNHLFTKYFFCLCYINKAGVTNSCQTNNLVNMAIIKNQQLNNLFTTIIIKIYTTLTQLVSRTRVKPTILLI